MPPKRKLFEELSTRQKQRRIKEQVEKDLEDLREIKTETSRVSMSIQYNIDEELSARQKQRRIQQQVEKDLEDFREIETETSKDSMSIQHNSDNVVVSENCSLLFSDLPYLPEPSTDGNKNEYENFLNNMTISDLDDEENLGSETESENEDISDGGTDIDISDDEQCNLEQSLGNWYRKSTVTRDDMNELLSILIKAGHTELHRDIRSIIDLPKTTLITPCDPGEYLHFGLEKALQIELRRKNLPTDIEIDINIDGLPITKTTKRTLWPILGLVVGDKTPFAIGIYHGCSKPKSISEFMNPFINEYKRLHYEGFIFMNKKYKVNLRLIICDSPARCFCTGSKYYNGRWSCPKCLIEGDTIGKAVVFLKLDNTLRDNRSFRERRNPEHHNNDSPFEELDIDMVNQFIIDYMHAVLLEVVKLLLKLWMKIYPVLSHLEIERLSNDFVNLAPYVPKEFSRKPQSILELGWWKATTFRLWLLYFGPIILSNYLPTDCVTHFNSLSLAIRILCNPDDYLINNDSANDQLRYVVKEFQNLYTQRYCLSNVHYLLHLSAQAAAYGPLDNISAFPFENFMKFLKKILRKHEKPLQQLHRRLSENRRPSNKCCRNVDGPPQLSSRLRIHLPLGCEDSHKSLKFQNFELTTEQPNNCCIVNNEVIVIKYIGKKKGEKVVLGHRFKQKNSIQNYPIDSTLVGVYQVSDKNNFLEDFSWKDITRKACLFEYNGNTYAVSFLHF